MGKSAIPDFLSRHPDAEILASSHEAYGYNRTLKIVRNGEPIVLKIYDRRNSRHRTWIRHFFSLYLMNKTSCRPRGRMETEREMLELWRREGFDTPRILDPPLTRGLPFPCLALEWLPGRTLHDEIKDPAVPLERKRAFLERFGALWYRRHNRAVELRESRLIFEHPTFKHIFLSGDRMVHFDFEYAYIRAGDIERLIRREILGFLQSMPKPCGEDFPSLFAALARPYRDATRFDRLKMELKRYGSVPCLPVLRLLPKITLLIKRYRDRSLIVDVLDNLTKAVEKRSVS